MPVSEEITIMAQWILGAALLLGLVGDALFQGAGGAGLNWLFFAAAAASAAALLARRGAVKTDPGGRLLMGLALAFSALMALRDSEALHALCLLVIVVATAGAVSSQEGWRAFKTGFLEYAKSVAKLAVAGFIGPTRFPREAIVPAEGAEKRWNAAPGVGRGLLIVSPLFFIFLFLLMAADPAYQYSVRHLFDWDISTLALRLLIVAVIAWCAAGILHRALQNAAAPVASPVHAPLQALGLPEVVTILAAIDLLFLSFVAVQARYAFGGPALVKATTGLTFAEYARGGFFELLAVAAIVLPVLLFLHWSMDRATPRGESPFRWLAAVQVALLFVMLASAFRRMDLYEAAYGLTELRLYVMAAIVWLAIVFAWFGLTVLRGRRELFAGGAVAAAAIGIAILEGLNPDALIARANLAHAQKGHRFDGCYASSLGADAVPPLVAALPALPPADAAIVASQLLKHWTPPTHIDWRSWTLGRAQAWNAVESNKPQMTALAMAAPADACSARDYED
jgi:hypothetical protein